MDIEMQEQLAESYSFALIAFEECEEKFRVDWVLEFYNRLTAEQKDEFMKRL